MLKRIIAIMLMGVMISCMLAGCGVVSTKNNQTEKVSILIIYQMVLQRQHKKIQVIRKF